MKMRKMSRFWMMLVISASLGMTLFWSTPVKAIPLSNTAITWDDFTKLVDPDELDDPTIAPGPPFFDLFVFAGGPEGEVHSAVFTGAGDATGLYVYIYQLGVYSEPSGKVDELSVPTFGPLSAIKVNDEDISSFYISSGVPEGFLLGQGDKKPESAAFSFNVVSWAWPDPNYIPNGKNSYIVGFFSQLPPTTTLANLSDSGEEKKFPYVYTPSPEPSVGLLMGIGLLGSIFWRRRKRLS